VTTLLRQLYLTFYEKANTMSGMEQIKIFLREAIDTRAVTIQDLARTCGCSRMQIYNILKDEHTPSIDLAEKILNAIGAEIVVKKRSRRKISA
jgi:DNA-binding phage protein